MLKKLLLLVVLVCWVQYSYSESITPYYGYTGNAAANGLSWQMDNVLPEPPGLDINTVIYSYTPIKNPADPFTVSVQNENAIDGGYIFREVDDWSGIPGGIEIRKVIGVGAIPRAYWGDGSIETTGFGTVTDPNVVYTYKVNPCFDPQFDPSCPGYEPYIPEIPTVQIETVDVDNLYDVMNDENVDLESKVDEELIEKKDDEELSDEEKEKRKKKLAEKSKDRLEKALAEKDNSALFAEAFAQSQMLSAMNNAIQMTQQYSAVSIDGGTYNETVVLDGGNIPDNRKGRRYNLSTQKLHNEMVDMQYNR